MYDLKHELIAAQIQLETANKQIEELKEEINKYQKNVVRLETELEDLRSLLSKKDPTGGSTHG